MTFNYKYECLLVEKVADYVIHVKLNRPRQLNALNSVIWQELEDVFVKLDEDPDCRVVVISGEGRAFCAGIDLKGEISTISSLEEEEDIARRGRLLRRKIFTLQQAFNNIEKCSKPVIAAMHGVCYGAAIDLTTACDIRYASKCSKFSIKEVDIGMAADVGTLARIHKVVGSDSWIKDICITARVFEAAEAFKQGFISKVSESKEEVKADSISLAKLIAIKSPVATQGTKNVLNFSREHTVQDGNTYVATWNASQLMTEDLPSSAMASLSKSGPPVYSKL